MAAAGHRWPGQPTPVASDSETEFGLFSHHAGHVRQSSLETEQDLPSARQRLRDMLDDPSSSGVAQAVHYFIIGAIITGSLLTVVETMPTMRIHAPFLDAMDFLVTIIYSIEIVLRFYATDDCVGFCVFFNIVDVASTLPGYLELVIRAYGESPKAAATVAPIRILRIFRVVRLLRVVRVFKLVKDNHYAQQTALLVEVITEAATHSGLCVILLLFGLMTVIASTLLYLFEAPECLQGWATPRDELYAIPPQDCTARSNFDSIPAVFWWAVTTLTTVGYGDMVPTSPAGRVVAGLMCVCGVMIMAVASAQFSLLFRERWVQAKARDHFRRQLESHSDGALARERDEIEQLAANMRHTVDQLVAKVAGASLEAGDGSTPAEVAPLLMSIKEHAAVLNVGTCSFIYDALASALLESEAKSAIAEVPPDAEGRAEFSTPARQPSMSDVGSAATTAAIVRQLSPAAGYPGSQLGLLRKRATTMALTAQEMCLDEDAPHPAQMERRCSDPGVGRHRSANVLGEDTAAGAEGAGAAGPTPTGLEPEPLARASEGFSDVSDVSDEDDGKADGRAAGAVLERPSVAPARPAGAGDEGDIEASDGEARGCAAGAVPERPALALARPAEAGDKNDDVEADDGEGDGRADVEAEGEDEGEHDKGSHGEARDENAAAARPARAASEDAPDEGPQ